MRAFNFRLQPVLNLKTMEKQSLQKEHQRALNRLHERLSQLEALQTEREGHFHDLLAEPGSKIDPKDRVNSWQYIRHLQGEIDTTKGDVVRLETDAQKCFDSLIKKLQEEKGLEKLRENMASAHNADVLRHLQKEVDEMAQQQYLQKQGNL